MTDREFETSADIRINDDGDIVFAALSTQRVLDAGAGLRFARAFLEQSLNKVPKARRVAPPYAIVGRLLEAARWHQDSDPLYEMFAELLTKACDSSYQHTANPAYVEIVRQLCPDEARLLFWIAMRDVTFQRGRWFKTTEHMALSMPQYGTEIVSYEMPYWRLGNTEALTMGAYFDHLRHIGLIGEVMVSKMVSGRRQVEEMRLGFTPYGALFVTACLPADGFQAFASDFDGEWDTPG